MLTSCVLINQSKKGIVKCNKYMYDLVMLSVTIVFYPLSGLRQTSIVHCSWAPQTRKRRMHQRNSYVCSTVSATTSPRHDHDCSYVYSTVSATTSPRHDHDCSYVYSTVSATTSPRHDHDCRAVQFQPPLLHVMIMIVEQYSFSHHFSTS